MAQTQALINNLVNLNSVQNIPFNSRRITGAGDAVDQQDYVTLSQVGTLISTATAAVTQNKPTINISSNIKNGNPTAVLYIGGDSKLAQDATNFNYSGSGNLNLTGKLSSATLKLSSLTVSKPVKSDASKNLISGLIVLTSDVSGILPVSNGGSGLATLTQYNVLLGNAAGTVNFAAPGTSGWVLTSNGAAANPTFQAPASAPVTSVNTRTGAITLTDSDVTAVSITPITIPLAKINIAGANGSLTLNAFGRATAYALPT